MIWISWCTSWIKKGFKQEVSVVKKYLLFVMCLCVLILLAGCGSMTKNTSETDIEEDEIKTEIQDLDKENDTSETDEPMQTEADKKILVVYFSATGNTRPIAEYIAEYVSGDIYEIVPMIPYTDEDLDYTDSSSRTSVEKNDSGARPEIKGELPDMSGYTTIFIGYPIWNGQAPRIISTFIEKVNLSGKTIIPFCTSHSSGIGSSDVNLHSMAENSNWIEGKRFEIGANPSEIEEWIDGLNIDKVEKTSMSSGLAPTVELNSGYEMPILGLGTYSLEDEECVDSVYCAIQNGYRSIDTAYMYHNEEAVGEAVRKAIDDGLVTREEMFITTKLYPSQYSNPEQAIEQALERLDIEYIDLMLLHHPGTGDVDAYKAIEKYIAEGKIRSVGLSNWYIEELDEFLPNVDITPAIVQNEIHPYYQEQEVVLYIQSKGIVAEGWYPLGGRGHQKELLADPVLKEIAENHDKTVAQVILRWNVQRNVIAIPGSSNPDHIAENINIFDFELTDEEMEKIALLERNEKHDWY